MHLSKNFRNVMDCVSKSVFSTSQNCCGFQWLSELFHGAGADLTELLSVGLLNLVQLLIVDVVDLTKLCQHICHEVKLRGRDSNIDGNTCGCIDTCGVYIL